MLTISKALSASQAQSYHAKEFTSAEQRYYSQEAHLAGEWQGQLAQKWGLIGEVDGEHFARLAQGQHPHSGEQLVQHRSSSSYEGPTGKTVTSKEHRAAWDATFSAPKSVSLTALVGGDTRVREAHRESVRVALDELERYVQARIGGNHPPEPTGKWAVAKFEHDTARPVDGYAAPQLHTHSVIFNVTQRQNGDTRALQERELFKSQGYITAVYQSELTSRLARLGYEIETGRSGAPEIKGYSQEYLEASSPRSGQIRQHLERTGFNSPEAAEIAAHQTRDRKQLLSPSEVLAQHRELAAHYGNQADRVVAAARERNKDQAHKPEAAAKKAQEAVTFARDKLFEREAVVDQRLLLRDALRRSMGSATLSDVDFNYRTRLAQGEFITKANENGVTRKITTRETLAAEHQVLDQMRRGQGRVEPLVPERELPRVDSQWRHLNESQRRAVEQVLSSQDRVMGIQGIAGTGKTTSLNAIRQTAEDRGYTVRGLAPTSRAARQLEEAGIPARTLQHYLLQSQAAATAKILFFVDESSLASTKQMQQFLARLPADSRVVLVGDIRQHQGVEAGKPYEQLQEAGMRTAKLDHIVRQRDPSLREVVELLARGESSAAFKKLEDQGRIHEIAEPGQRLMTVAQRYLEEGNNALVISPDNQSRRQLNQLIHKELQRTGRVQPEEYRISVLVPRQDLTGAERQWAARYDTGDVLRYSRGSAALGLERGDYAQVVSKQELQNTVTVRRENGEDITYDPRRLQGVNVYRELEQGFSVGDRIQFTAPDRELGIANRELGTIEAFWSATDMRVALDSGRRIDLSVTEHRHFDSGYAVTSHSSQSLTAEQVFVHIDTAQTHPDLISNRLAYVSVSRGQHDVQIFTDNTERLMEGFNHEVSKTSALELAPVAGAQPAAEQIGQAVEQIGDAIGQMLK
jgi:conjugative relaxase-like TrwC/TraI family protein